MNDNIHLVKSATLVYGFWGQNIGNAFFNIGGKWLLEQLLGANNIFLIADHPAYRTFYPQLRGNPRKALNLLEYVDTEYLVAQGPLFSSSFPSIWGPALERLSVRGIQVVFIGSAFFKYTREEFRAVLDILKKYPPKLIATRDPRSYRILKEAGISSTLINGIDSAFFVPEAYEPTPIAIDDYIVLNFDRRPEPKIAISEKGRFGSAEREKVNIARAVGGALNVPLEYSFQFADKTYHLQFPVLASYFAKASKALAYIGHALDFRRLPDRIDGHLIVRTEHRSNPFVGWKVYRRPHSVVSDEPFTYLTVYAHAKLVLSDRVHANVAALAYGTPTMLFSPSPRGSLFEAVGAKEIRSRPVSLDPDLLRSRKEVYVNELMDKLL